MHSVWCYSLYPCRALTPVRRFLSLRPCERARERLVRAVASLDRDVEHGRVAGEKAVCRSLEQHATAECARRFAGDRGDDPVEVGPRQMHAPGEVLARCVMLV